MILHAAGAASLTERALAVAVVLPPGVVCTVALAGALGCPASALAATVGATIHVASVAPSVHPELAAAVAALP
jgi:hypothetical protein